MTQTKRGEPLTKHYERCLASVDTANQWHTYRCRRPSTVVVGSEWGGVPLCTQHRKKAEGRGVSIRTASGKHLWIKVAAASTPTEGEPE